MIPTLLQIAVGGGLGAVSRHLVEGMVPRMPEPGMPLGILVVNVLGCLLMGLFLGSSDRLGLGPVGPFIATGFLGGFTTFSTFAREAITLMQNDQPGIAVFYIGLSLGVSLVALYLGLLAARVMI